MLTFKFKFYERSPDGLLKQPPAFGSSFYDEDTSLRGYFNTEQDAKNAVLNLKPEDEYNAAELILVQEVVHTYE